MVNFGRKSSENTVIFRRFFAENEHSAPPGVLIKSGVLLARIRYSKGPQIAIYDQKSSKKVHFWSIFGQKRL